MRDLGTAMAGIVLINPPLSLEERYGKFARGGTQTPPIGLAQLAAVTRLRGHPTAILDCPALGLDYDAAVRRVRELGFTWVGLTAVTPGIDNAGRLARELKRSNETLSIILGGPHLTAAPEATMLAYPDFDLGVIGEGEETLAELLGALPEGAPLEDIRGIIYRPKAGGLRRTDGRPFIANLDDLPLPAWDLLPPLTKFYETPTFYLGRTPSSSLVTSRGCCGRCSFCDRSVFGNACRMHSAERVVEMMQHLHDRFGINDVIIHDDAFVLNRKRVERFCALLLETGHGMTWGCNARVNMVDPDILRVMKAAGCRHIGYGIESGSQRVLNVIRKGITLEQITQAAVWTHGAGIRTRGFFMIGHPTETEESIRETIDLAKSIPIDDFQITFFTPFPGSEIHQEIERYGSFDGQWQRMNMWEPLFVPKDLTREQLIYWQRRAFREFYLRPRTIWRYARLMRNPHHAVKLLRGGITLLEGLWSRN